jgi:hypothetical protein
MRSLEVDLIFRCRFLRLRLKGKVCQILSEHCSEKTGGSFTAPSTALHHK